MDTSLIINATNSGKKVTKAITNINPDKDNTILKTFAQKVNALTTNTYVDATRVDKMSVNESVGNLNPNLRVEGGKITWDGNGSCSMVEMVATATVSKNSDATSGTYLLDSDGTYHKDWLSYIEQPTP